MHIWDVLQKRRTGDEWQVVGSINAPDLDLAMLLARETHFRHKEAEEYALRQRGQQAIHECPDPTGIGGITDRSYRRQDGYVGVGAKFTRIRDDLHRKGLAPAAPRADGLPGSTRQD